MNVQQPSTKYLAISLLLALPFPSLAQVSAESFSRVVEARLKSSRALSRLIGDSSDDLTSAIRKLDRQVSEATRGSEAWKDVIDTQDKIDRGMQGFSKILLHQIAADELFLGEVSRVVEVNRSPGIANSTVERNLVASIGLYQSMAQALTILVQQLEQQASAAKGLAESARDLPEFRYAKRMRDATVDVLEDSARLCRKRTGEYESMLKTLRR